MFFFGYNDTDYKILLGKYARAMYAKMDETGLLIIPDEYGKGYLKVVVLPNSLHAILFDYTINSDIFLNRLKSKQEYYTLCFDEMHIVGNITVKFGKDFFSEEAHLRSAAVLTSSLFDFGYIGRKGTRARGIHILISKEWMSTCLGISLRDKLLQKYIALKTASFNLEPLDADYRHLLNETLEENKQVNPMRMIIIQNRIMLLIERFFTRLYQKMKLLPEKKKISDQEIHQLMNVEFLLVKDFSKPPPSMPELARISMMSQTKLKALFKMVYTISPYGYFQKNRMLKAKYLLNTRQYTIKEVGVKLGFQNLSNFAIAFKKEFDMLPSDV